MPELPEIVSRAREMRQELVGKVVSKIDILQPKCLNMPPQDFAKSITGAVMLDVQNRGKWLFVETCQGWLLLNLGMGGEILLTTPGKIPEKRRLVFYFTDGSCLSINFWWFGYAHFIPHGFLDQHKMTFCLGPNATDLSPIDLHDLLRNQKGQIKSFLLDQSKVAGIGNAYIHDILFLARLHPLRKIQSLSKEEIDRLGEAIQLGLQPSLEKNGAFYEMDIYGNKGGFQIEDILVGYREGKPCPNCGTAIQKIKTGSTSSYICPVCQPL